MNIFIACGLFFSSLCLAQSEAVTINRGNGAEPDSLNIHLAQGLNSQNILMDMYEGLMTFDAHGEIVKGSILSYQVSANQLEWQFNLNPAAKWSDGEPLTANDFITAWQQAMDPNVAAPYGHLFNNLTHQGKLNATAINSQLLQITLNQPDASLLKKLVLPVFYPLPSHSKTAHVSNGPFHLVSWNLQENITLKKNNHYHSVDQVKIDEVIYWVTENQNSELLRFRAKELDITETIPDHKIDWLKSNLMDELKIAPYYGTFFLGLNLSDPHLRNPQLRMALSLAIDRDILVEKVLKSGQEPAYGIIPALGIKNEQSLDLKSAKKLLAESQFNTNSERIEILYNNSDNQKKVALAVSAMWRQNLGIKTQLRNQEWKVFVVTRKGSQKQVFRSGWIADYFDPLNFLELFHSQSQFNFYGFANPEYDHLLGQLNSSSDKQHITQLINHAENILQRELPVIPLYHYVSRHLVSQEIDGYFDNLMDKHLSRYLSKR